MNRSTEVYKRKADEIENNFKYHQPKDDIQIDKYENIRNHGRDMGFVILNMSEPSREQSLALTKLEEAVMWANASIARNE